MRTFRTGQQEVGEAFAGGDGFIHVRWASGEVTATEQSSLLLVLPCMRRPAGVMKRPAGRAGKKPAQGWEEAPDLTQAESAEHSDVGPVASEEDEEQHQADEEQEEET